MGLEGSVALQCESRTPYGVLRMKHIWHTEYDIIVLHLDLGRLLTSRLMSGLDPYTQPIKREPAYTDEKQYNIYRACAKWFECLLRIARSSLGERIGIKLTSRIYCTCTSSMMDIYSVAGTSMYLMYTPYCTCICIYYLSPIVQAPTNVPQRHSATVPQPPFLL